MYGNSAPYKRLGLHAGDWIVVKPKEEILATLDENARLDGLPFQPEMFAFCGKQLRVAKVAHKTCDNIRKTGGRRMVDAVHLEGARCDGSAHGDCQADCVFFWKEAWLERADNTVKLPQKVALPEPVCMEKRAHERARAPGEEKNENPTWVCQTTALYDATTLLPWWDVRQYVYDVTSGNHSAWYMIKLLIFSGYRKLVVFGVGYRLLISFFNWFQKLRDGKPYPFGNGNIPDGQPTPTEVLNLQPGEWVEVRPQEEILNTITYLGMNRGMRYDQEMSQYCGNQYQVQKRVDRLISEHTGKMVQMKNPCIQLENVYCRAVCTTKRLGCPRASNTYWREVWLRRVDNAKAEKIT